MFVIQIDKQCWIANSIFWIEQNEKNGKILVDESLKYKCLNIEKWKTTTGRKLPNKDERRTKVMSYDDYDDVRTTTTKKSLIVISASYIIRCLLLFPTKVTWLPLYILDENVFNMKKKFLSFHFISAITIINILILCVECEKVLRVSITYTSKKKIFDTWPGHNIQRIIKENFETIDSSITWHSVFVCRRRHQELTKNL